MNIDLRSPEIGNLPGNNLAGIHCGISIKIQKFVFLN